MGTSVKGAASGVTWYIIRIGRLSGKNRGSETIADAIVSCTAKLIANALGRILFSGKISSRASTGLSPTSFSQARGLPEAFCPCAIRRPLFLSSINPKLLSDPCNPDVCIAANASTVV